MSQSDFFFQQRRGQLKLRNFASLDLQRVVRDVDVDLLQSHLQELTFANLREEDVRFMTDPLLAKLFRTAQLMIEYLLFTQTKLASNLNNLAGRYSQQKESLHKKRHELADLKELVAHLEDETQAKKQGMAVLETLLLDGSKARREVAEADALDTVQATNAATAANSANSAAGGDEQEVVTFFVVDGRVGLCVEFSEYRHESVSKVLHTVVDMFQSAASTAEPPKVKLVHRGVVLSVGSTLGEVGVRQGDTVVAIVQAADAPVAAPLPLPVPAAEGDDGDRDSEAFERRLEDRLLRESNLKGVLEGQEKTMRGLTDELRRSFENALESMQKQQQDASGVVAFNSGSGGSLGGNNEEVLARIDERYSQYEAGMRQQLDAQLEQYEHGLKRATESMRSKASGAGELESDEEGELDMRPKHVQRMEKQLQDIREVVQQQNQEFSNIRELLTHHHHQAPAPAPAPAAEAVVVVAAGSDDAKAKEGHHHHHHHKDHHHKDHHHKAHHHKHHTLTEAESQPEAKPQPEEPEPVEEEGGGVTEFVEEFSFATEGGDSILMINEGSLVPEEEEGAAESEPEEEEEQEAAGATAPLEEKEEAVSPIKQDEEARSSSGVMEAEGDENDSRDETAFEDISELQEASPEPSPQKSPRQAEEPAAPAAQSSPPLEAPVASEDPVDKTEIEEEAPQGAETNPAAQPQSVRESRDSVGWQDVDKESFEGAETASVDVAFPVAHSLLLARHSEAGEDELVISVPAGITPDDLFFELRRGLSLRAGIDLAAVLLQLHGAVVSDPAQMQMPAEEVARLAAEGKLVVTFRVDEHAKPEAPAVAADDVKSDATAVVADEAPAVVADETDAGNGKMTFLQRKAAAKAAEAEAEVAAATSGVEVPASSVAAVSAPPVKAAKPKPAADTPKSEGKMTFLQRKAAAKAAEAEAEAAAAGTMESVESLPLADVSVAESVDSMAEEVQIVAVPSPSFKCVFEHGAYLRPRPRPMADAEAENVGTVDQGDLVQVRHIAKSSKHGSFYELKSGGFCPVEKDGQPILLSLPEAARLEAAAATKTNTSIESFESFPASPDVSGNVSGNVRNMSLSQEYQNDRIVPKRSESDGNAGVATDLQKRFASETEEDNVVMGSTNFDNGGGVMRESQNTWESLGDVTMMTDDSQSDADMSMSVDKGGDDVRMYSPAARAPGNREAPGSVQSAASAASPFAMVRSQNDASLALSESNASDDNF